MQDGCVCGPNEYSYCILQDGYISSDQADMLMNKLLVLFAEIRPNAVALVDAFDYPDGILQSCLGRYDGRVYEALWDYCQQSPMNTKDVSSQPSEFLWVIVVYSVFCEFRNAKRIGV